ncbi:hypothetical protein BHECKSOX2_1012 [Bathymodiolus heckerae thiotrophic gill symbiont]|nr:hypothetical protein BHECKSOX2_1012 [Bathymodiolus heckerae thiotrophic gill symbiont]
MGEKWILDCFFTGVFWYSGILMVLIYDNKKIQATAWIF